MNAEYEVQKAIFQLLDNNLAYEIFDDIPEGQAYPYIVVGEATAEEADTKTYNGFEVALIIHYWSRFAGREEVKQMMGAGYDLLHNTYPAVAGYNTVHCLFEFSETFLEDDGVTRHGVQRFNLTISDQ